MNVFITGGCGFIGSHLAERLLGQGDSVTVLDDLSTGSMENVAHLIGRPGFNHRIGSALDRPLVAELVDDGRLRPVLDRVLTLGETRSGYEAHETEMRRGKVVIHIAD